MTGAEIRVVDRRGRLRDRKPPPPRKPDRLDLRPVEPERPERTFRPERTMPAPTATEAARELTPTGVILEPPRSERATRCAQPACPRWPDAPVAPGRRACAECARRVDARGAELARMGGHGGA